MMGEAEDGEFTADCSRWQRFGTMQKSQQNTKSFTTNGKEKLRYGVRRSILSDTRNRLASSAAIVTESRDNSYNSSDGSSKKKKLGRDTYLLRVLQEAEKIAYEPKRINLIPTFGVQLPSVIPEKVTPKLSIESLLTALRFENPKKEVEECESEEELAEKIFSHVSCQLSSKRLKSRTYSMSGNDQTTCTETGRSAQEYQRLKSLIQKLQNDKNKLLFESESERNKSLTIEVENLKRQVADLVDLLKRKEDESGCSILLLQGKSPGNSKSNHGGTTTEHTLMNLKGPAKDWSTILSEQKATIDNLSSLVKNLRIENSILIGRLRLEEENQLRVHRIEASVHRARSVDERYPDRGRRLCDLRSTIRSISRSRERS